MTSAKNMGSGIQCDPSDTDFPKKVNEVFDSFTTALNTLYKLFTFLFDDSSALFHSLCV